MNYYTQLQNIIKKRRAEMHDGYIEEFKKVVWPFLKERAKCGETHAYFCGMNRALVEAAHAASLLEGFSLCESGIGIVISWA